MSSRGQAVRNERAKEAISEDAKHKQLLSDFGLILKERALEAKVERNGAVKDSIEYAFRAGRLLGFNEVVSIFQEQAKAFGISPSELRLGDLEPDRDLV